MKIETVYHKHGGYTVIVNDEIILECLSEDELGELTIALITELYDTREDY